MIKKIAIGSLIALLTLCATSLSWGAPQPLAPELGALAPTDVLPAEASAAAVLQAFPTLPKAPVLTRVDDGAFRVETFSKNEIGYAVEAKIPIETPVEKGEVCLARFAVRAIAAQQETGEGIVGCYFQQTSAPYQKSVSLQVSAGPDWTYYDVPFTVATRSEVGQGALYFALGNLQQTIEIKDAQVLNFGSKATLAQLPTTKFSYVGREANAKWREDALQRIEQIRVAPLQIVVNDAQMQPVEGARVEVKMTRSDFVWGTAMETNWLISEAPDGKIYREKAAELFNSVTIANGLKWQPWMNAGRRADTLRAVDWIEAHQMRLRAHNLVWPGWKFSPARLATLPDPKVELPRQIETRIEDGVSAIKGRAWAWDVVNEPLHERDFFSVLPETAVADWFKQAHRLDPNARLFVNEYAMLNSRTSPDFIARYLTFIQMLKDNGAPLDGIGVQGHIGAQVRNPTDVLSDLDLLQKANLPINISEFDIDTKDEALQADYTRDFLIACYSHRAVNAFTMWGFWQKDQWKPNGAMFRTDWSEKPNAKVWRDLVMNQWHTQFEATTNAAGEIAGRGHLGTYEITVTKGDKVTKHTLQLTKASGVVRLTLQ